MNVDEKSSFLEIALLKQRRALSESSEDVKLIFLLLGIEALYNSKSDRMKIPDIIRNYNERLSEKAEKIIDQSYWRRNQIVHGEQSDLDHISKLVPKLQQVLHTLIIHQLNLGVSPEFLDTILVTDQEAVVL